VSSLLQIRRVLVIVLGLGLFAIAARPVVDPDVWWHLRTGQLIVATHAIPHTDPFSFTRSGYTWITHEWLSEVIIYWIFRITGFAGLTAFFAGAVSVAMMLVYFRSPGRPFLAALVVVWGALASAPSWGVRPQVFSLLFTSLFLFLIERSRSRPQLLWWTVPLMLLWVNLHAGFALGLALLFLALLGSFLDVSLGFEISGDFRAWRQNLAVNLLLCSAVVILNPNGFHLYTYPLQTLFSSSINRYIAEWSSPNFHQARNLPFAAMILALVGTVSISRRRLLPSELLLLTIFIWAGLHSVRHIPIFVLAATPVLTALIASCGDGQISRLGASRSRASRGKLIFNGVVLIGFAVFTYVRFHTVVSRQSTAEERHFPAGAVSYFSSTIVPSPMLNSSDWGGYLIWKLYPRYRVFSDGRADLYGDEFMNDSARVYYLKRRWQAILDRWQIRTVVLPPDAPLVTALRQMSLWTQVYADPQAVVLVREYAPPRKPLAPGYGTKVLSPRK
jgi:hypothetical protein